MKEKPLNLAIAKVFILLASTLTVMAGAIVAPSLPQMSRAFPDTPDADFLVKLTLTLPALFIGICSPLVGYLIDRYGRLGVWRASFALYAVAGTSGFYLADLYIILVGRAFLGAAVAGIMTTALALIGDYFTGEARNKVAGVQGAFMTIGGVVFIFIAGFFAETDWRAPFLIYAAALFFIPATYLYLREPERQRAQSGSGAILNPKGFDKTFLAPVLYTYALVFLGMLVFYMVPVQGPFLLERSGIKSPKGIAAAIAGAMACSALASFAYPGIKKKLTFQHVYGLVFLLVAVGFGIVAISSSYITIITGLMTTGLGLGMLMPNSSLCLMNIAPDNIRGKVMSGMSSAVFIGQFLSPFATEPFINAFDAHTAFGIGGAICLMLSFIAAFLSWPFKRDRS